MDVHGHCRAATNHWIWIRQKTQPLILLMFIITPSACFNIDTKKTWSFTAGQKSLFGQNVMQFKQALSKGVYVTSPLKDFEKRTSDGLYKCFLTLEKSNLRCELESIAPDEGQVEVLRSVLYPVTSHARNSDSILTCQQVKARKRKSTTGEVNGVCSLHTYENGNIERKVYNLLMMNKPDNIYGNTVEIKKDHMQISGHKQDNANNNNNNEDDDGGTEIAIVLDGSGSISEDDFQKAKDFIFYLMTKIWETCNECEFAVVQYGAIIQTEFDISNSRRDGRYILDTIQRIEQVGNVTKTASALLHVLDNIFNKNYGSKESATKIILVLTDGEILMDPVSLSTVVNDPRMKSIERFSIGVGEAFNRDKAYRELKMIATDENDHVIKVEDYSKLDGLLSALQQRIIGIEGTKGDLLEFDLAQIGFSAHLQDKDTMVLGAVGAFDWSGGLMLYNRSKEQHKVTFLNESADGTKKIDNSYLGYSVTTAQGKHTFLYIGGAPRHSKVGRVLVFEKDVTSYHLSQTLEGEQLGSYFGHQLCTLDVESDGIVDFLLVGAPFYHIKGEEGRVYIYNLNVEGKFTLVLKLDQLDYSYARFGYSIAMIGDINQDGYQDIAIGAPLEGYFGKSESFGSVYIYNSNADKIIAEPSQRIKATDFKQKLQYFGQSVDGGLDLTEDGYPDLAIGSLGKIMVLRSRPVAKVNVSLNFQPENIPVTYIEIPLQATLCFDITPFNKEELKKTYLDYTLDLDVSMDAKRIVLKDETFTKGTLYLLSNHCTRPIALTALPCRYDCFSDIMFKVSYTMRATDNNRDLPSPILDFYSQNYTLVKLPYEKSCSHNAECLPKLHLTTQVSRRDLIVGATKDFTMTLFLENTGYDSYMTNVTLIYPRNLKFNAIKPANNPNVKCYERLIFNSYNATMNCSIQHPVFKTSNEIFHIIWQLSEEQFSGTEAVIYTDVSNLNGHSGLLLQKTPLTVKYSISAVLTVQPATIYVKIPPKPTLFEEIQYTFKVSGENPLGAELGLELQIPISMQNTNISEISPIQKTQCTQDIQACRRGNVPNVHENILQCLVLRCNRSSVQNEIQVAAKLFLHNLQKLVEDTQEFNITGELLYDKETYVNLKDPNHRTQGTRIFSSYFSKCVFYGRSCYYLQSLTIGNYTASLYTKIYKEREVSIVIVKEKVINVLPVIIGGSIGGIVLLLLIVVILFKCGFFKRKYKQFEQKEQ